jgi:TetR/AcrR family transcriptional regulator, transcriptional repressor for nem operon
MYSETVVQHSRHHRREMRVTKAQAQANRAHVVETASVLFRQRGYDGVGVADLMAAAGFTHGGFYKQFQSKADLMAESAAFSMANPAGLPADVDIREFVQRYLSRPHRDAPSTGCTLAALGADAARQETPVRATFAAGVESLVAILSRALSKDGIEGQVRGRSLDLLAHAVGAMVISRACPDDSPLANEVLATCCRNILSSLEHGSAPPSELSGDDSP